MKFYENRLPLGGIKVPFNLNQDDDIYKDNMLIFHVQNKKGILKVIYNVMDEKMLKFAILDR